MKTTILGAGLAGLSVSHHLGHENCVVFEKSPVHGGHAGSSNLFGFTVDCGPHVSFTKSDYVRELFSKNTREEFLEYPVQTRNYYQGHWIDHPAQAHLWQLPEPLRTVCSRELLAAASIGADTVVPDNYAQWLDLAYGATFAATFSAAYTRKYWTTEPRDLSVDWLGPRMPKLNVHELNAGMVPGSKQQLHYITHVRYPKVGGYQSFFNALSHGADLRLAKEVAAIDLKDRKVWFSDGSSHSYARLVSTLPITEFVNRCHQATEDVREAAAMLDCSQLLIVDVFAAQTQSVDGHWFYVYDETKWSTRIHCIERLSPTNAPLGWTGIQVEVYFSKHKPFPGDPSEIANAVVEELVEMGFLKKTIRDAKTFKAQWRWSGFANIMFTHPRRNALEKIWTWLEEFGLKRNSGDTDAATDWNQKNCDVGMIAMAGRFAEWKYYWTDDCVLRGLQIAGGSYRTRF